MALTVADARARLTIDLPDAALTSHLAQTAAEIASWTGVAEADAETADLPARDNAQAELLKAEFARLGFAEFRTAEVQQKQGDYARMRREALYRLKAPAMVL